MTNKSTLHLRNLKFPLTETSNFLNGLSPSVINKVFKTNDCPYDLEIQEY